MTAHTTPNQQQPREQREQGPFNATLPAGFQAVPPAQYLFRDANPAASPDGFIGFAGRALGGRNSLGPICANYETKCAQGDWCCNTGGTCSFDTINGAFLCCGASAGASGCTRVCAAGTFQCSSVCCTYGQTCYGGDTVSGYCISQGSSYTTSTVNQNSRQTTTAYRGDYQSSSASPYGYDNNNNNNGNTQTTSTYHNTATGTQDASRSSSTNNRDQSLSGEQNSGGMSLGVQVAISVAVPLIVILIAVGVWFCIFRRRAAAKRAAANQIYAEKNAAFAPTSDSPSPIVRDFPSLPRDAMIVATPVEPFEFGRTRTRTSLPPPHTAETYDSTNSHDRDSNCQANSTPTTKTPRLPTPIDLLTAVAARGSVPSDQSAPARPPTTQGKPARRS
ncbi:hypothetical protein B0T25DRAFT_582656 [Lasiosphaeria hispida]|uniref:Uncharacterized protein n=1 Tax=Lasiosphaeria hispida TaxID=260671 RepID=A0AAJ0MD13_9PEZI|nr:hypothetical protein B0T25DRAFT_582656 [Lasiosphaeria hispida]